MAFLFFTRMDRSFIDYINTDVGIEGIHHLVNIVYAAIYTGCKALHYSSPKGSIIAQCFLSIPLTPSKAVKIKVPPITILRFRGSAKISIPIIPLKRILDAEITEPIQAST